MTLPVRPGCPACDGAGATHRLGCPAAPWQGAGASGRADLFSDSSLSVSVPPPRNGFWHRRCPKNGLVVYSRRGKALLWTGGRVPANGPVLWWAMAACAAAGAAGALAGRSVG